MSDQPKDDKHWEQYRKPNGSKMKKILELSQAFLLVVFGISLLIGVFSIKSMFDSQKLLSDTSRQNQEQIIETFEDSKDILLEVGYAVAILAMLEDRIIPKADANKSLDESIVIIKSHSEKLGKLADYINNYRINTQNRN